MGLGKGEGPKPEGIGKMNMWIEIPEGTVGVLKNGSFFQMGETEVMKVSSQFEDETLVLDGQIAFKTADVRFIQKGE